MDKDFWIVPHRNLPPLSTPVSETRRVVRNTRPARQNDRSPESSGHNEMVPNDKIVTDYGMDEIAEIQFLEFGFCGRKRWRYTSVG